MNNLNTDTKNTVKRVVVTRYNEHKNDLKNLLKIISFLLTLKRIIEYNNVIVENNIIFIITSLLFDCYYSFLSILIKIAIDIK